MFLLLRFTQLSMFIIPTVVFYTGIICIICIIVTTASNATNLTSNTVVIGISIYIMAHIIIIIVVIVVVVQYSFFLLQIFVIEGA